MEQREWLTLKQYQKQQADGRVVIILEKEGARVSVAMLFFKSDSNDTK